MDTTDPAIPRRPALRPAKPRLQWLRVIFALIMREMTTTYARNSGGYLWAVAEPVLAIAVLTFVFSILIRTPDLGTSFALFYATGFLPFQMFTRASSNVGGAVRFSRALMQYPSVTPLDAVIARIILNLMTLSLITTAILTGVIYIEDLPVNLDLTAIISALAMAMLLGAGIGACNAVISAFFPTWDMIWSVATRPLFIISGVFYTLEQMPALLRDVLVWNPLVHVIATMRTGIYGAYHPDYLSPLYVWGIGAPLFLIGLHQLRRHRSALIYPRV